ncbi:LysR family transcriptional regulator [Idiomarina tyrosinivorans]|uniref:LysR family transcriptional regulator n=1 Tax=Idiomarina tyrosinivorans TaxID=1445662 RepID=A0A432ZTN1_9GAMM|nr:LysR family transcriptional regulator [Idiomarina tyrosinivorans]RUO81270.1 LysR family transcriptional regulator [Idiomarina tyrosinivorans]
MKNKTLPSLNALRVFDVAARSQSFKQAAQQLGVTQSAVTRQIQALEEQLSTRLFQRDNRVHALTQAGLELAPELAQIFSQLQSVVDRVAIQQPQQTTQLTIAISSHWLRWWLSDQLADFQSLYPHVQLNFQRCSDYLQHDSAAEAAAALQHEKWDLVIAGGHLNDRQLRETRLCDRTLVPVSRQAQVSDPFSLTWLMDRQNPEHQAYEKQHSKLQHARKQQADDCGMAIDLLKSAAAATLVDQKLLEHPELQQLTRYSELSAQTAKGMQMFYKSRKRQPVALVAFMKWLQLRAS